MVTNLFRFNLTSVNPKALVEFYRDVIGMPVLGELDSRYDGVSLGFVAEPHLCIWLADENKKANSGSAELVFMCDDVDKTYEQLRRQEPIAEPPFETYWGGRVLELRDPDGNLVRLRT
ncbi:MAG: VOC family protein [Oscillospiraceae bacterium]|jgi:catechol 2,3-dioxygenase-like lactoylglutathione lyase family enzyme|nr:VOC family protein [Oscillospiraceae bacterium]